MVTPLANFRSFSPLSDCWMFHFTTIQCIRRQRHRANLPISWHLIHERAQDADRAPHSIFHN